MKSCECWAATPAAAPLGPRNVMGTLTYDGTKSLIASHLWMARHQNQTYHSSGHVTCFSSRIDNLCIYVLHIRNMFDFMHRLFIPDLWPA